MSGHTHSHGCGCEAQSHHHHDHHHEHHHACGCGSQSHHHHEHNHNCGCNPHESHDGCCEKHNNVAIEDLNETELLFLRQLLEYKLLPVSRFIVTSSKQHDFNNVVLSPVFIVDIKDSMEQIKNIGKLLNFLQDLGLVTLDYDIPLEGYAYKEFHDSEIFAYFNATVTEAREKGGFLGDIPTMECGSIAPTEKCIKLLEN